MGVYGEGCVGRRRGITVYMLYERILSSKAAMCETKSETSHDGDTSEHSETKKQVRDGETTEGNYLLRIKNKG